MNKLVISAFPGVGKSYFKQNRTDKERIADSDSSQFSWINKEDGERERNPEFPQNYIDHIKGLLNGNDKDIILVSSHGDVRSALFLNDIKYYLVYPDQKLKQQYIKRYIDRGSPEAFVQLLRDNWQSWIEQLDLEFFPGMCQKVKITAPNVYLKDLFKENK